MANTFKNAFAEDVATSAQTIFTAGGSAQAILIGLQLTNTTSSEITSTITMNDRSESEDIVLLNAVPIPANTLVSVFVGDKIVLESSDVLKVHSNTGSALNVFASYLEIT